MSFALILTLFRYLASGTLLLALTKILKTFYLSPLHHIPGPKSAALTDLWMLRKTMQYRGAETLMECFNTYGPLLRIGPTTVVVRRPEDYATIYKRGGYRFRKAAAVERVTVGGVPNVGSMVDPHAHAHLRRLTNPLFSSSSLSALHTPLHRVLNALFVHVDRACESGEGLDMWKIYRLVTFDFMGEAAFGRSFNTLKKGENIPFMEDLDKLIVMLAVKMSVSPFIWEIVRRIPIKKWKDICGAEERLLNFARSVIAAHPSSASVALDAQETNGVDNYNAKGSATRADGRYDMISHILHAREKDKEECESEGEHTYTVDNSNYDLKNTTTTQTQTLSDPTISSTVLSYIIAGTDTTATTMSWLTYVLARDVWVQDVLREEVMSAVEEHVSETEDGGETKTRAAPPPILPYDRIRALPYLTAFIREGLRVYPPTSLVLVRVVPEGDGADDDGVVFQGRHVPGGTTIGCSPYIVHRNADIFPDPERFDPERWLVALPPDPDHPSESGQQGQRQRHQRWRMKDSTEAAEMFSSYMPWSAGVRGCQGQALAELELYTLFATLVSRYRMLLAPECTEESMRVKDLLVLMPKDEKVVLRFERL